MFLVKGCFPTSPGGTPITTTTPLPSGDCCPALVQTPISNQLADGFMSFAYNSDTCRSTATVTCQQPQGQGLELQAAIVVNQINFIDVALDTLTLPATCVGGVWQMAQPPLNINEISCVLTDPV
uniref:C6 domain-containing protein n=1 Tax=Panagrolaimus sp. PS1159 TaxID=55785 RepID=A0AC35G0K7_9BILA